MRARRPLWLAVQGGGAALTVALRAGALPLGTLLAWSAAVIGLCLLLGWRQRRDRTRLFGRREGDTDTVGGVLLAIAWSVALALFGGGGNSADLQVLGLSACMLAATGVLLSASPIGGLSFIVVTGTAASAAMVFAGQLPLAIVAFAYTGFCAGTLIYDARALVRRLRTESALAEKQEMVSLLLHEFEETGGDWLWRTDANRCLTDVSPRLARQFGRARDEIEGQALVALLAGEDWQDGHVGSSLRELADRLHRRESFRDLKVPVRVDGDLRWWSLSATPRRAAQGQLVGFWGVGTDVTEAHRSAERIDRMARFDALTGLANRPHLIAALGDALRAGHQSGHRSALMLIDLDLFKQVNDTLGHPIGDKLLIAVAKRLRALVGGHDICARLGGDEFAVVLAEADNRERVDAVAEAIVASLSAPYDIEEHRLHIGASVGSATSPRDGRAVETLMRNADLALYRAKDDGRGVHRRYEQQLHAAADERRRIEQGLREALEHGHFCLVYQPIVEAGSGALTAFEALLRWTHPELGPVSPDVFIPVAEEARLIGRIGEWVMQTATRDAAAWPDRVRVTVNMAAAQMKDPQLAATIVSSLSHSGLAPDRLELEIAEEVFLRDGPGAAAAVDKVLSLGVRVSLSDFGTSRSTFGYLRKGRFSTIKIDRSFVRGVHANAPESVAIVRAIVAIADGLGMATIAEGAETTADYDRMLRLGCAHIQGWLIGQPLDADGAADLAETGAAARRVA